VCRQSMASRQSQPWGLIQGAKSSHAFGSFVKFGSSWIVPMKSEGEGICRPTEATQATQPAASREAQQQHVTPSILLRALLVEVEAPGADASEISPSTNDAMRPRMSIVKKPLLRASSRRHAGSRLFARRRALCTPLMVASVPKYIP
jgi:hypothetical protein